MCWNPSYPSRVQEIRPSLTATCCPVGRIHASRTYLILAFGLLLTLHAPRLTTSKRRAMLNPAGRHFPLPSSIRPVDTLVLLASALIGSTNARRRSLELVLLWGHGSIRGPGLSHDNLEGLES